MRKTERHTSCYEQFHYEIDGFRILLVETHVPSFELVGTDDLDHGECIALTAYAVKCIAATMERRETSASNLLLSPAFGGQQCRYPFADLVPDAPYLIDGLPFRVGPWATVTTRARDDRKLIPPT